MNEGVASLHFWLFGTGYPAFMVVLGGMLESASTGDSKVVLRDFTWAKTVTPGGLQSGETASQI